jgi:hypothetical protein
MAKRYTHSSAITVEPAGGCLSQRVTQTFVRRDALEARAHGRQNAIELDERVKSLARRSFVPAISRCAIAEDFNNNNRRQQIGHRRGANEIVKTFCLSASLLLGSVAVRTAQRVVAADSTIRIYTIQRLGDRKRRRPRVEGRRSQRLAGWNPIVMQSLGCLVRPLSSSALFWRTGPSDGRLPLGREE